MAHGTIPTSFKKGLKFTSLIGFLFFCFLLSFSSCKNKDAGGTLTAEDSVAIFKYQMEIKEKIYYVRLTAEQLRTVLTPSDATRDPNDIKQLHFTWYEYEPNGYALAVYGADNKGNRLNEDIRLQPDNGRYETNWDDFLREKLMVVRRGDLKYLLGSGQQGKDVVIEAEKYKDIVLSPLLWNYPATAETMFFSITGADAWKNNLLERSVTIYTNPSPPYNSICNDVCDQ